MQVKIWGKGERRLMASSAGLPADTGFFGDYSSEQTKNGRNVAILYMRYPPDRFRT